MTFKTLAAAATLAIGLLGGCANVDTRVDSHCPSGSACGPSTGAAQPNSGHATGTRHTGVQSVVRLKPGTQAAVQSGGRTFTPVSSVQVDAQGRMPARSPAPLPAELYKKVVCNDPHCAPIRPVMPVGGTALMFTTPSVTIVEKVPSIDCARTPGCTRGVNPVSGMTAGMVDNGAFNPHAQPTPLKP